MNGLSENLYNSILNSCREHAITKQSERELQATGLFCFESNFIGFSGHFPGMPILPAVVQMAAVRCLAELLLKKKVRPLSYSRTKFRGVVKPEELLSIQLQMKRDETDAGVWLAQFSLRNDQGEILATGQGTFGLNEAE